MRWAAAVIDSVLLLSACGHREPLPVLGAVPDFTLTDQAGHRFFGSSLRGHVWIADFIYTNCPGPCPLMSQRMTRVQIKTAADPSIRLVSFSVDPARDTPAALRAYAKRFAADTTRWSFLTGAAPTLDMLDRDAFKLGSLNAAFEHSTRFALVDRQSRIRGYYGFGQEKMTEHLVSDALALAKERS